MRTQSILMTERGTCYACGNNHGYELHHIFGGYGHDRDKSTKYGLVVWLCPTCHRDNVTGVHGQNIALKRALQRDGQMAFERAHSHEEFIKVFGKNYL